MLQVQELVGDHDPVKGPIPGPAIGPGELIRSVMRCRPADTEQVIRDNIEAIRSAKLSFDLPAEAEIWAAVDAVQSGTPDLLDVLKSITRGAADYLREVMQLSLIEVGTDAGGKIEIRKRHEQEAVVITGRGRGRKAAGKAAQKQAQSEEDKTHPRDKRIQAAAKKKPIEWNLAVARYAADAKDDLDKPEEEKVGIRCPTIPHGDPKASAWVMHYEDGPGWGCKGCEGSKKYGSNLVGLTLAYHHKWTRNQARTYLERALKLTPWAEIEECEDPEVVYPEVAMKAEAQPQSTVKADTAPVVSTGPQAQSEPAARVADIDPIGIWAWLLGMPHVDVHMDGSAWVRSRALSPHRAAGVGLARGLVAKECADWPEKRPYLEDVAGFLSAWVKLIAGWKFCVLIPTVNHLGQFVGVRARGGRAKCMTPSVNKTKMPQAGVMASAAAVRALRTGVWPTEVWIAEGETDFLTLCEVLPIDSVIFGLYDGEDAWTDELGAVIPNGSKVRICTDPDGPGSRYRRKVIRTLKERCRTYRIKQGTTRDVNDLHVAGKLDLDDLIVEIPSGPLGMHDADNAVRVADHVGGRAIHAADLGWLVINDGVWERDKGDKVITRLSTEALRRIPEEAQLTSDPDLRKAICSWGMRSLSRKAINDARQLASASQELTVDEKDMDQDPNLLGTANGVLDLERGDLVQEVGGSYVTRRVPHKWDPLATCPVWEKFLLEVFAGDVELVEFLRRWMGYCLTGSTAEQKLVVLHGETSRNGKSTILEVMLALMGEQYAHKAGHAIWSTERAKGAHETDRNQMRGRRATIVDEWPRGVGFDQAEFKSVTGARTLQGRGMREDTSTYGNTTKGTIGSNPLIEMPGEDHALWARILFVPFNVSWLGREDRGLFAKLEAELTGILVWAAKGTRDWLAQGLNPPACVTAHTAEAREEADDLARWAEAKLEFGTGSEYEATATELLESWSAWAATQKMKASEARRLTSKNIRKTCCAKWPAAVSMGRDKTAALVQGVRVRANAPDPFVAAMKNQGNPGFDIVAALDHVITRPLPS